MANRAKFSPTKLRQTEFLTNKEINSYLFTEEDLNLSPTKRVLLLILNISHQRVGEKCHCATLLNLVKIKCAFHGFIKFIDQSMLKNILVHFFSCINYDILI